MRTMQRAWNVAFRRHPAKVPAINPFARMGLRSSNRETPTATYAELQAFRAKANVSSPKQDHLRNLAKRTLNGMCIMLLATVINLSILFHMSGQEQEWMCFMFCTLDGKDSFVLTPRPY